MGKFGNARMRRIREPSEIRKGRHFLAGRERLPQRRRMGEKLHRRSVGEGYFENVPERVDFDGPAVGQDVTDGLPLRGIEAEVVFFDPAGGFVGCHVCGGLGGTAVGPRFPERHVRRRNPQEHSFAFGTSGIRVSAGVPLPTRSWRPVGIRCGPG